MMALVAFPHPYVVLFGCLLSTIGAALQVKSYLYLELLELHSGEIAPFFDNMDWATGMHPPEIYTVTNYSLVGLYELHNIVYTVHILGLSVSHCTCLLLV